MNQSMAKRDAKEWYIQTRIAESAEEILSRKKKKKDKIQAERDEEWDRSHAGERAIIADQKLTLVKKLQSLWTVHKARKKQAALLDGLWRLECDVETQALYYVNTRDGTVQWEKPLLLGSKELDPPNRWYECRDVNGVTFYYHPFRMDAVYQKPWDYDGHLYEDPEAGVYGQSQPEAAGEWENQGDEHARPQGCVRVVRVLSEIRVVRCSNDSTRAYSSINYSTNEDPLCTVRYRYILCYTVIIEPVGKFVHSEHVKAAEEGAGGAGSPKRKKRERQPWRARKRVSLMGGGSLTSSARTRWRSIWAR